MNENRVVTQVITWALFGVVDVNSDAFEATKLADAEKTAIRDVMANSAGYIGDGKIVDVTYLTCELHGTSDFGFDNCQPQLVPIYGEYIDVRFDNKVKEPEPETFDVSCYKTKYQGRWAVEAGEFSFDLFTIDDDGNISENSIGTFWTDAYGVVTATGLAPGKYVFVENWAHYYLFPELYTDWVFVWNAIYPGENKGHYFEITTQGETIWRDWYEDSDPIVDNVFFSKHTVFWTEGYYEGLTAKEKIQLDYGWITIFDVENVDLLDLEIVPADCNNPERWWFTAEHDLRCVSFHSRRSTWSQFSIRERILTLRFHPCLCKTTDCNALFRPMFPSFCIPRPCRPVH